MLQEYYNLLEKLDDSYELIEKTVLLLFVEENDINDYIIYFSGQYIHFSKHRNLIIKYLVIKISVGCDKKMLIS